MSSFIVLIIILLYLRDSFKKTIGYYDEQMTTYSDFSIMLQNLPNKVLIDSDSDLMHKKMGFILREFFNDRDIFTKNSFTKDGNYYPTKILLIAISK